MSMDRAALRRLKVGEKIVDSGVEVERLKSGDLRYKLALRVDGVRIHRTVGTERGGMTFQRARAIAEQMKTDARHDRLNLPRARKVPLSFGEAAEKYLDTLAAGEGRDLDRKRAQIDRLVQSLGTIRLDALSTFDLQRYRKARRAEGVGDATCNRECAVVSHLFTIALRERWIERRPCAVPRTHESRKPRRLLADAECAALLKAAAEDHNPLVLVFTHFLLGSGMRHREILATRWEQIDWQNRRLVVPQAKSGQRLQPLSRELVEALQAEREYADESGWIFPSREARAGHVQQMSEPFRRAVIRAGLDPRETTPHALRHRAITQILRAGADLRTAQSISGHRSISSLLHYLHASSATVDKAMTALDRPAVTETSPDGTIPLAAHMRKP
jgi:site-specific recombinase XerD